MEIDKKFRAIFLEPDELEVLNRVNPDNAIDTVCRIENLVPRGDSFAYRIPLHHLAEIKGLFHQSQEHDLDGEEIERYRLAAKQALEYLENA